jgi:hypothetical protein
MSSGHRPARVAVLLSCLSIGCYDKGKEASIAADLASAKTRADSEVLPYRNALGPALRAATSVGQAPCAFLPSDVDWKEQAAACGQRVVCAGVTVIPFINRTAGLPLESTVVPSRVRRVRMESAPDGLSKGIDSWNPTPPDYKGIQAEIRSWSTPAFWSYEIVVVDDGAGPTADGSPVTRKGRAFAYDYQTRSIRCAGTWTATLHGGDDGVRDATEILAAVPALRAF